MQHKISPNPWGPYMPIYLLLPQKLIIICKLFRSIYAKFCANSAARHGKGVWEAPWQFIMLFFFSFSLSLCIYCSTSFFFSCPGIWKNRRTRYEEGAVLVHTTDPGNCCQIIYNQRLFNIQQLNLWILWIWMSMCGRLKSKMGINNIFR